jgi:hypothetical protein
VPAQGVDVKARTALAVLGCAAFGILAPPTAIVIGPDWISFDEHDLDKRVALGRAFGMSYNAAIGATLHAHMLGSTAHSIPPSSAVLVAGRQWGKTFRLREVQRLALFDALREYAERDRRAFLAACYG